MWFKYGLGASALYLCFTLRPAISNSLRPVTVGSGRVGKTCESSVDNKIKNEEFHRNNLMETERILLRYWQESDAESKP